MAFDSEELNKRREERLREQAAYLKQMKLLKIGLIVTVCVMVLCCAAMIVTAKVIVPRLQMQATAPTEPQPSDPDSPDDPVPETTAPEKPDTVIHLVAGGDVNVTDTVVASGYTGNGYDYSDVLLDVMPVLAGGDLSVLNFEGNLYGTDYGAETRCAPQELMTALRNAGADLIQTANTHSITNGLLGLSSTVSGIKNAGIQSIGTYATGADFERSGGYLIREVDGIRIAFVAFTKGMDGRGLPKGSENCVNLLYKDYNSTYQSVDTEGITKVLQAAAEAKPDLTVALLHWGSEYNNQISTSQKKIVSLMAKEGVDAIIGTHSHYVQSVGFDEETGMFVAYSLGDLLGDADRTDADYSILLDLEITKDGDTGKVSITGYSYTPIYHALIDGKRKLLQISGAISAYENNSLGRVSDEIYTAMKDALARLEKRLS